MSDLRTSAAALPPAELRPPPRKSPTSVTSGLAQYPTSRPQSALEAAATAPEAVFPPIGPLTQTGKSRTIPIAEPWCGAISRGCRITRR